MSSLNQQLQQYPTATNANTTTLIVLVLKCCVYKFIDHAVLDFTSLFLSQSAGVQPKDWNSIDYHT